MSSKYFYSKSKRLSKYLYSLGFDKENIYDNGCEICKFERSNDLNESLDFYFYMRKRNKNFNNKQENNTNEKRDIWKK